MPLGRGRDVIVERRFSLLQILFSLSSFKYHKHILYTFCYVWHILELKKKKKKKRVGKHSPQFNAWLSWEEHLCRHNNETLNPDVGFPERLGDGKEEGGVEG